MHAALKRLVDANSAVEDAQRALDAALAHRKESALGLAEIVDDDARWQAALLAFREFGAGLSLQLAEAATGQPGRKSQSHFLVRAGRRSVHPKRHEPAGERTPLTEWPAPDTLERTLIAGHIEHGEAYVVERQLGWGNVRVPLKPAEARAYLEDPTAAMAAKVGLAREDLVEWLTTEGSVFCDGVTAKGEPCKSMVLGLNSQLGIGPWRAAKARGGYCRRHGG